MQKITLSQFSFLKSLCVITESYSERVARVSFKVSTFCHFIILSPVSSSPLKTTEYHQKANITRLILGFSWSARHSDILYNYICVYVTHNIYIYINIFIHTWIHTYIQTDRQTQIHRCMSSYAKTGFISLFLSFTNF